MADDPLNTAPVPEQYLSKDQLRDIYIDALKGRQAREKATEIRSPVQVLGNWAQALADRRYEDQIMAASRAQQQGAAGGLFGAGGGTSPPPGMGSGGTSPASPAGGAPSATASADDDSGGGGGGDSTSNPVSLAALKLSAMGETSKGTVGGLPDISPDSAGSKSYGPMGLNSRSGSLTQFVQENPQLKLDAEPGSAEFDKQWRAKAASDPEAMLKAHENWHSAHVMKGLTESMTNAGVDPKIAQDPRVQIYMADRKVQMGGTGLSRALAAAKDAQSPEDFVGRVSATDKAYIPANFPTYLRDRPQNIPGLANRIDKRYRDSLSYREPSTATAFAPTTGAGAPTGGPGGPGASTQPPSAMPTQTAGQQPGSQLQPAPGATQGQVAPAVGGATDWTRPQRVPLSQLGIRAQDLPQRPIRNWDQIQRYWGTYSPKIQEDLTKEWQERNNPITYKLSDQGGSIRYFPGDPNVTWVPNPQHETRTLPGGFSSQRTFVLSPFNEKIPVRVGGGGPVATPQAPAPQPTTTPQPATPQPGPRFAPTDDELAAGKAASTAPAPAAPTSADMTTFIKKTPDLYPTFPGEDASDQQILRHSSAVKEYEGSSEEFRKEYTRLAKESIEARDSKTQLQLLEKVLQNPAVQSGWGHGAIQNWSDLARVAQLGKGETATWNAIAEKLGSRQQVSDVAERTLGQGTAVRAMEADAIKKSQFSLDRPPEANLAVARLQLRAMDRIIDNGKFANEYAKQHGRLDNGFYQSRDEWFAQHPFMTDEELGDYRDLTKGAPSPDRSTAVTGPAGSNPPYQAALAGKEPGDVIHMPGYLSGRGLPGGTTGQKAAALATAATVGRLAGPAGGAGAGGAPGLSLPPGAAARMAAGAGPTSPISPGAAGSAGLTQQALADALKQFGKKLPEKVADWAIGAQMFNLFGH